MNKAVIYARYSSDRQNEQSIEGQLSVCYEYARREKLVIIETYIDRAVSGTTADRPEFIRMIKDSYKKDFQYVIVYKLDRFARNRYDSATNNATLKKNGVRRLSATEGLNDSNESVLLESMLEGYAEYYSLELGEKVRRGIKENLKKGYGIGGSTPYGYKLIDKKYYIDEAEASIIRRIFNMAAANTSANEISKQLFNEGILNKQNKAFPKNTILDILRNKKYIGIYEYNGDVFNNVFPSIVSEGIFNDVASTLNAKKVRQYKSKRDDFFLTGKLFCGNGTAMSGVSANSKSGRYFYYVCKPKNKCKINSVRKELLESYIAELVLNNILTTNKLDPIISEAIEIYNKKNDDNSNLKLLQKSKTTLERELRNLLKAIKAGIVSPSLQEDLSKLEGELAQVKISISKEEIKKPLINKEALLHMFDFYKRKSSDKKFIGIILESFVQSVILTDDDYVIIVCSLDPKNKYKFDLKPLFCSTTHNMVPLTVRYENIYIENMHLILIKKYTLK